MYLVTARDSRYHCLQIVGELPDNLFHLLLFKANGLGRQVEMVRKYLFYRVFLTFDKKVDVQKGKVSASRGRVCWAERLILSAQNEGHDWGQ